MTPAALKKRNEEMLKQCWPAFAVKVRAIIEDMAGHGFSCRIQEAYRSPEDQLKAVHAGMSHLKYGFHNCTGDNGEPQALAVDLLDDKHPNQESTKYSLLLYACARAHGLTTGGTWGLAPNVERGFRNAAVGRMWDEPVKVGWDNCHIEPTSITVAQAKSGKRI